jgi:D-sedoheptulose 7-phosphate isomerase
MEERMDHLTHLIERYPALAQMRGAIEQAYRLLEECYEKGGKLLVCGNGGSAADSDHIVGELMKGFYKQRMLPTEERKRFGEQGEKLQGALPAIALTQHGALSTAFLNDVDPAMVFAQQVYGYGQGGDVFLGLSTSGNSANVVLAAKVAAAKGMKVITMTGRNGGKLKELSDVCMIVPAQVTADIQEYHLPVYHTLCAMLEEHFFPDA